MKLYYRRSKMKIKVALGVLLLSMSASVFAQPGYDRHDRYDRDRHHQRADRVCFANGKAYRLGSSIRTYKKIQVCERIRGRAMWVSQNRHRIH